MFIWLSKEGEDGSRTQFTQLLKTFQLRLILSFKIDKSNQIKIKNWQISDISLKQVLFSA